MLSTKLKILNGITIVYGIGFIFLAIVLTINIANYNIYFNTNNGIYQSCESLGCDNLSFFDTARCLNKKVKENFIYRINDDKNALTLEELFTIGGDCKDWTEMYDSCMGYYGYSDNQKVLTTPYNHTRHVFLIASNKKGYCHIDMKDINCFKYKD